MASGIALGMNYLHTATNRPLIHADLKMKNVLISDGFKPKVSVSTMLNLQTVSCLETFSRQFSDILVLRVDVLIWSWSLR